MLKVRGIVESSGEGSWLRSDQCKSRFFIGTDSLTFGLALTYQSAFGAQVSRNNVHIQFVQETIKNLTGKSKQYELMLTLSGLFETRKNWTTLLYPSGEKQLWGFGHENVFPAQLVTVDISDPQIVLLK